MAIPAGSAWIESNASEQFAIGGNCSIGRSSQNTVRIGSKSASRRHATIQAQNAGEFWLIDFGSVNGTLLNGRRISMPTMLSAGDRIGVAGAEFTFHFEPGLLSNGALASQDPGATIPEIFEAPEIQTKECWLLIADIEGFTPLCQRLAPEALAVTVGTWLRTGRDVVESHRGVVNKYVGDGYLAYWNSGRADETGQIAAVIQEFRRLQKAADPRFRVVVHHGAISIGGIASHGEECLHGPELNFAFRLEKLAGELKLPCLLSQSAKERVGPLVPAEAVPGEHRLKGFDSSFRVFSVA